MTQPIAEPLPVKKRWQVIARAVAAYTAMIVTGIVIIVVTVRHVTIPADYTAFAIAFMLIGLAGGFAAAQTTYSRHWLLAVLAVGAVALACSMLTVAIMSPSADGPPSARLEAMGVGHAAPIIALAATLTTITGAVCSRLGPHYRVYS